MSHHDDQANDVVKRMAALRRELDHDVKDVADSARAMTDWTFYVRRFPWLAVGLAAAAGFLVVPRKKTTVAPTDEQLAELMKKQQFVSASAGDFKPQSMFKGLAATLAAMAARAAIAYIGEQLKAKAAGQQKEPAAPSESTQDIEY